MPSASYSQLKQPGVESNLFMYHLQQLIKAGLVQKEDKRYSLTKTGKQYADRLSLKTMEPRLQPKIISILVVNDNDGKYLILERLHQPFIGTKGFPSGKIHFGEALIDAAYRELNDKANLTPDDVKLELRGNISMRFLASDDKDVVNHVIGYVYSGQATKPVKGEYVQENFRSYWGPVDLLYGESTFMGHKEIFELLNNSEFFVESLDFESSF